jgi:hypothetical protein
MSKAISKYIGRRSLLKGSAAITAATALATVPAIAGARDPILDLIAEADRLHTLAKAASERVHAASDSVGGDCDGCGWPPLDTSKPELKTMLPWLERWQGHPYREGDGISRSDIEQFNERLEETITHGRYAFIGQAAGQAAGAETIEDGAQILAEAAARLREMGPDLTEEEERTLAQYRREGKARLAWWDRRQAEREHNAEISGFYRLNDECDAIWDQWGDANAAVLEAHPVTIEGAIAQLEAATKIIRDDIEDGNGESLDIDKIGMLNAYEALARLTRRGDTA